MDLPFHMIEKPYTKGYHRERMMEIFFEEFNVPKYFVTADVVCSMVACAERTGLCVDFGWETTSFVPIYETSTLQSNSKTIQFGARDITKFLNSALLTSTNLYLFLPKKTT